MEIEKNILKFSTFKKKRNKNFLPLPHWFEQTIFAKVRDCINSGEKLLACKYLCDISKAHGTRDEYGLSWAKCEIVDEIIHLGGTPRVISNQYYNPTPVSPTINRDEIINVLRPFVALANQCLYNSNLQKDQIVYAYNNAQITMQDLRNVENLQKRLMQ